jgi:hypothetical protein
VATRRIAGIVAPLLVTVAAAALLLRLLNGVPAYWQRLTAAPKPAPMALAERLEYSSIEEAGSALGVEILTPSYFPSYLEWPPVSVRGQREPVRVVSMLFSSTDGLQALQIRELFWAGEEPPFPIPEPADVMERQTVEVNGVPAELILGKGQADTQVNQLRWRLGDIHLIATTICPPEELLRIARSIHR